MGTVVDCRSVPKLQSVQSSPCLEFSSLGTVLVRGILVPSSLKRFLGSMYNLPAFPNGLQVQSKNLCQRKREQLS